jgi:hypothetical protein
MTRWLTACLAAGLLSAPAAMADEPVPLPKEKVSEPIQPPIVPPPPVVVAEPPAVFTGPTGCAGTISLPKYYLQEVQSATTLPRMFLRDEIVGTQPGGPVLDFVEQRQFITVLEMKPREEEQEVTCMKSEPITTVDSCGKPCTTYQQVPDVRKVKITVFEPVSVQREVIVRVPVLKPGRDLVVKRIVLGEETIPAIESRFNLLTIPNEVNVPVAPPACLVPECPVK